MANWSAEKIQQKNVDELIPYDRNPNIHPDSQIDQLANSVREWGWTVPILIDENDMVLAGHGRLFAAKRLEMKTVPCIVAEGWSEQQKKAYVIADNKLSENSQWDDALYFSELKSLSNDGFNVDLTGFENLDLVTDHNFDFSDDNYEPKADAEEFNQTIIQYVMIFDNKEQQDVWHNFLLKLKDDFKSEGTHSSRVYKHLKSSGF
jgi:ParB-like chromosome segregation protein Spo0J